MFTGIIQCLGVVRNVELSQDLGTISIDIQELATRIAVGDSVSVNGVCLTAINISGSVVEFEVMGITLSRTNLGALTQGSSVNLELPLTLNDFIGGHMVQGHIDEIGVILEVEQLALWKRMRISTSLDLQKYIVLRGSIAVDGVSLTVSAIGPDWFEVSLIPATLEHTILGIKKVGSTVNLESDIVARHLEKLVQP